MVTLFKFSSNTVNVFDWQYIFPFSIPVMTGAVVSFTADTMILIVTDKLTPSTITYLSLSTSTVPVISNDCAVFKF